MRQESFFFDVDPKDTICPSSSCSPEKAYIKAKEVARAIQADPNAGLTYLLALEESRADTAPKS